MEIKEPTDENDIEFAIYSMLEVTISHNIDMELAKGKDKLPFPKEELIGKIIRKNMDALEASLYLTRGKDRKIYLAGDWLMRPVFYEGKMISSIEYLKIVLNTENIVFCPDKSGTEVRKDIW